jgi:hypothetical protein
MRSKSFKENFSIFHAVILGVVLEIITIFFLKGYIGIVTVLLIGSVFLFKEKLWLMVTAIFTTIGFDRYYSGDRDSSLVIFIILFGVAVFEIGVRKAVKEGVEIRKSDTTFWNKVLFSSFCLPLSTGFLFLRIFLSEINHPETQRLMSDLVAMPMPNSTQKMVNLLFDVFFSYLDDFFMILSAGNFLSGVNQLIILVLWILVIMPWFWAGLLTAIKYANFNLGKGNKIFSRTILAYIGQLVASPVTFVVAIVIPQFFVVFNLESVLPFLYFPDFALVGSTVFMIFVFCLLTSIGAVWGAGWSKS